MPSDTYPFQMSLSVVKQWSVLIKQCPENNWRGKPLLPPFGQRSSKGARRVSTGVPFCGTVTCLHTSFRNWELDQTLIIATKELWLRLHHENNLHLKLPFLLKSSTHSLGHLLLLIMLRRMHHQYSTFFRWENPGRRVSHLLGVT